ncbi:uncharacterized protein LOC111315189 isoform X1 [Durio zibethinus]|uniref:Uncharacterized protein LOC111315189 isoform X1 n=1 Tax=Durio zibethinus TaxID=66656 RepID=A0A6P6B5P0_DURZI|nr:uncharacterized protein LOC111315189 isoform X1 [Durio zibethinus]
MHRSSSSSRVSNELFINSSSPSQSQSSNQQSSQTVPLNLQQLPTCNPLSHAAKKERSRLRSAENSIHIIPLLLVLCAIILSFFVLSFFGSFPAQNQRFEDCLQNQESSPLWCEEFLASKLELEDFNSPQNNWCT